MNQTLSAPRQRDQVYYWKCDRAAAFHGTIKPVKRNEAAVLQHAQSFLTTALSAPVVLRPARTQGNHLTALANIGGRTYFTRIEDGPENDAYMEVESFVLRLLKIKGLPVPGVIYCNAERRKVPFAIQLIEWMDLPDLNQLLKDGTLELAQVSREIGASIGRWQEIKPDGRPGHPQLWPDAGPSPAL